MHRTHPHLTRIQMCHTLIRIDADECGAGVGVDVMLRETETEDVQHGGGVEEGEGREISDWEIHTSCQHDIPASTSTSAHHTISYHPHMHHMCHHLPLDGNTGVMGTNTHICARNVSYTPSCTYVSVSLAHSSSCNIRTPTCGDGCDDVERHVSVGVGVSVVMATAHHMWVGWGHHL